MIACARYARDEDVPLLGVCLGMQVMVIEFSRNVLKLENANSAEFDARTPHPVIIFMPEGDRENKGGTMRLGKRATLMVPEHRKHSVLYQLYGRKAVVSERHRHRYEVEPKMVPQLEQHGMAFVGRAQPDAVGGGSDTVDTAAPATAADAVRNEIVELRGKRYFAGCQFHPEFLSSPFV